MLAEIGHFLLILGFVTALLQAGLSIWGVLRRDGRVHRFARAGAITQFALLMAAFAILTWLFAVSDFSVLIVADNSHSAKPFLYKLTGVWGNHEGSMLLWALILTLYTAGLAFTAKTVAPRLITLTFAVQSVITSAFLAFLIFTSNPFARLWPMPPDGNGLNPLLQDPGLASHPPMLYAGYVGFSITFSFAVAALIEGRADTRWARIVRPWALAAWSFLTLGILLGASWAYFELGWGGWWAWDPVENASLMPWLAGTAFIHSLRVMEKRDTLKSWTLLLALMTFSLSLTGTFLVRSGVITSVHAFAVDPERGVFILAILFAVIGGSLALFAMRAHTLKPTGVFSTVSRESTLLLNNLVLVVVTLVVLVGTFYPLMVTTVSDARVSIGPPYYNAIFNPLMGALMILVPVSTMLAWKRGKLDRVMRLLVPAGLAAGAAFVLGLVLIHEGTIAGALGAALALWVGIGVGADLASRTKLGQTRWAESWRRLKGLPLGIWGMTVSHIGLAICIFAITGVSAWKDEARAFLVPGQSVSLQAYEIRLDDVQRRDEANYFAEFGTFTVERQGRAYDTLTAERRFYPVRQMGTTEAAVATRVTGDVYVTIGEPVQDRGWPVHVYLYPFAVWLWIGGAVLTLGGVLSIADRGRRALTARRPAAKEAS